MSEALDALGLVEDEEIALDEAALALAALDRPDVDLAPYRRAINTMATRVSGLGAGAEIDYDRASLLSEVINGEFGYTGDRDTYDDPDNANLIRVIDRRRGLPISLSILYVVAARRAGWTADLLNTPGHVVIRVGSLVVDPFGDGAVVGAEADHSVAPRVRRRINAMEAMTNRATLVRLLMNQATRAEAGGDVARTLELFRRMTVFAPFDTSVWWQRARLELAGADIAAARASLSAMLEMTREPTMRARIVSALGDLAG